MSRHASDERTPKLKRSAGKRSSGTAPRSVNQAARILALAKIEAESKVVELSPNQRFVKNAVGAVAILMTAFVVHMLVFTPIFHAANQVQLRAAFKEQLKQGIAPTSEVDFNDVVLRQGAPVALLRIPSIGLEEVIVEGTDSGTLTTAAGHRRDTVMPGQAGTTVLMGRSAAYGGPFASLQSLPIGTEIEFITGQGESKYHVQGVRYAGDYELPTIQAGEGRLLMMTARGAPFMPSGLLRLDAKLVSEAKPTGPVLSNILTLPREERELGFDLRFTWALAFALQFLLVVVLAGAWALNRFAVHQVYLVFVPLTLFAIILVFDQVVKVLPNLL